MAEKAKTAKEEAAERAAPTSADGSSGIDDSTGKDVAALHAQVGVIQQRHAQSMQTFMDWVVERADSTDEDQFAIMASIMHEIMQAESPAELLAERSALHAKDVVGIALLVHGFTLRAGDYEESTINHYAALECSREGSDETRIITCGGMKVLAKLMMLEKFGEWPQIIVFTSKETSKGYGVLDIVKPAI